MTDWAGLLAHIDSIYRQQHHVDMVPAIPGFPKPMMYPGQVTALEQLRNYKSAVISSHTGAGKTATFLTRTQGRASIIIEPRKFLQKQVQEYRNDVVLYGRSEYPCFYAKNAAIAPCNKKTACTKTDYGLTCNYKVSDCTRHPCKIFRHDRQWERYPCTGCKYIEAIGLANGVLNHGGTVICNFGNFWKLLPAAELVVVDEADLFFREISSPYNVRYAPDPELNIEKMIEEETKAIMGEMQTCTTIDHYKLQNHLYRLEFLDSNKELCFAYRKKDKYYVEINPENTNVLKDKIFAGKDLLIVTATPAEFNLPAVTYSIFQRAGIFYTPVGKLTSRSLKMQPWLMDNAGEFIRTCSEMFWGLYNSRKFVVHCGNIGNHATKLFDILGADNCVLHEAGNLMGTIDKFKENNKRYLLVASAEYGADFTFCNCQFILKVPYASYDDKMKALERKMGREKFNKWYTTDAIFKIIQQSGRVCRGAGDFGCTFILDSKYSEVIKQYGSVLPEWFKERMVEGVY